MSDYSNTFGGAAKDAADATILAADHDTEYDAIATMSATKADKIASPTNGNVVTMDANGNIKDGLVTSTELAILDGATVTTAELNTLDGVTVSTADLNNIGTANVKLNTKVIDIGDWNMDLTIAVNVPHGLTLSTIRTISCMIRNDGDTSYYTNFDNANDFGEILTNGTNIELKRVTSGLFDSANFSSTSYNRGWVTIQYTD